MQNHFIQENVLKFITNNYEKRLKVIKDFFIKKLIFFLCFNEVYK